MSPAGFDWHQLKVLTKGSSRLARGTPPLHLSEEQGGTSNELKLQRLR